VRVLVGSEESQVAGIENLDSLAFLDKLSCYQLRKKQSFP